MISMCKGKRFKIVCILVKVVNLEKKVKVIFESFWKEVIVYL